MLIGGTQVNVGAGIETTPGTAVAPTHFFKWSDLTMQAISEKEHFTSQRGVRNQSSNSFIKRKYSEGNLSIVPNVNDAPILFYLALGQKSTSGPTDSAYTHTFTVQNANGSMKTATFVVEDAGVVVERFAGCVVDSLDIEVSDSYAKLTAGIKGGYPDTSTLTESYSQETEFAYHQFTLKFGATLTAAGSASATPVKAFNLSIKNNVQVDEAFLSGANTPVAGKYAAGRLEITGSYTLHFEDTVELNKYKDNTKNAIIAQFTGALIGTTSKELLTMKLGRVVLTSAPKQYNIDGIVVLQQEFTVEYDATDKDITVEIVNDTVSYS